MSSAQKILPVPGREKNILDIFFHRTGIEKSVFNDSNFTTPDIPPNKSVRFLSYEGLCDSKIHLQIGSWKDSVSLI